MRTVFLLSILALFMASCEVGPKPINFGADNCEYCKMTIVDRQHASEIVTEKGRVYKFDAVECMVHYDQENKDQPVALYLTNDFNDPADFIDATKATYLVSKEIASPMGANLSAFANEQEAKDVKEKYSGEIFTWKGLQTYLEKR